MSTVFEKNKKVGRCGEGGTTTALSLHFTTVWRGKGDCCFRLRRGTRPETGYIDAVSIADIKEFKDGISRATTLTICNNGSKK